MGLAIQKQIDLLEQYAVHLLIVSILMLVLGTPIFNFDEVWLKYYVNGSFLFIVSACFLIIRRNKILRFIAYLTFVFILADYFFNRKILDIFEHAGLSFLILYAFVLVIKEAMSMRSGTSNMILISITGYLIIGLIGGFLAESLDHFFPDAYYHTTGMELNLYNYIYYSFVTLTTLGYGDIVPLSERAQSLALGIVLSGQLYLTIIMAMNIAKFMQKKD